TDSCFIDGAQFGGLVDRPSSRLMSWSFIESFFNRKAGSHIFPHEMKERIDRTFNVPSSGQYQPVKITVLSREAEKRYYKLHNGDILDLDTKTILDRQLLRTLLDA
ncbi:hypothetical protein LCGC14_2391270, partial [marine sediment metagenome]